MAPISAENEVNCALDISIFPIQVRFAEADNVGSYVRRCLTNLVRFREMFGLAYTICVLADEAASGLLDVERVVSPE